MTPDSFPLLIVAATMILGGCAALTYFGISVEHNPVQLVFRRYAAHLDRHCSFLLTSYRGTDVARAQISATIGVAAVFAVTRSHYVAILLVLLTAVPPLLLWRQRVSRVTQLERQLDTWLLMLANALKATSSVGEAIASTVALVPNPFSEEVDLLVKEIRLGAPLDRAVNALARRINSTAISSAMATIVVARQTGGDLPSTLEQASATLRESARLEGVLRTKTADGRGQVFVLASVPFVLCTIIAWLDPTWFDPMLTHPIGRSILAGCAFVWTLAAVWAHFIVKADL